MASYEKLDFWSLKAQKEGYPARSVYKLKELDQKFRLIKTGGRILDIGAAPGSWSLFVLRKLSGAVFLSAVDLSPLSREYDKGLFDGDNFLFLQGDLFDQSVRDTLASRGPYNLVLCDAAPATTGNRTVDTARSFGLVEAAIDLAAAVLDRGGNLAVKVFQGGESQELLKRMRGLFDSAKSFKPEACRTESFETYFVGLGLKSRLDA